MSLSSVGKLLKFFISLPKNANPIEKTTISVDQKGILDDKYYNTNINRSILITSKESYTLAKKYNISMPFGSLGENLLIDYNPYHLNSGDRLKIGDVVLEITQNCTICEHLSNIDKQLPTLLEKDRGIFAKVIVGGKMKVGDEIYLEG